MTDHIINIHQVTKAYPDHVALTGIDLQIKNGEFITLLGPSGCGKTTLLRMLAGFETPDSGRILLQGKNISNLPPEQRHINMVFQNYALFPHMTVFENIAFGLRCQKISEPELTQRVTAAIAMVHLEKFAQRQPTKLSGGQQQRVALARAVVNRPLLLLLDEPFSALDSSLRSQMQIELKQLQRDLNITFVFVTHDQEEALSMSDRIVVMNHGKIEQVDTARQVYEEPKNLFTATFIGAANIFNTVITDSTEEYLDITIEDTAYRIKNKKQHKTGDNIHIVIRPEDFKVWATKEITDNTSMIPGTIEQVIYKGSTVNLLVKLPSGKIISATEFFDEDDPNLFYHQDEKVWVEWPLGWEVTIAHD